jgi:hypothetical protein
MPCIYASLLRFENPRYPSSGRQQMNNMMTLESKPKYKQHAREILVSDNVMLIYVLRKHTAEIY